MVVGRIIPSPQAPPFLSPVNQRPCVSYLITIEALLDQNWTILAHEKRIQNYLLGDYWGEQIHVPAAAPVSSSSSSSSPSVQPELTFIGKYNGFQSITPQTRPLIHAILSSHRVDPLKYSPENLRFSEQVLEVGEQVAVLGKIVSAPNSSSRDNAQVKELLPTSTRDYDSAWYRTHGFGQSDIDNWARLINTGSGSGSGAPPGYLVTDDPQLMKGVKIDPLPGGGAPAPRNQNPTVGAGGGGAQMVPSPQPFVPQPLQYQPSFPTQPQPQPMYVQHPQFGQPQQLQPQQQPMYGVQPQHIVYPQQPPPTMYPQQPAMHTQQPAIHTQQHFVYTQQQPAMYAAQQGQPQYGQQQQQPVYSYQPQVMNVPQQQLPPMQMQMQQQAGYGQSAPRFPTQQPVQFHPGGYPKDPQYIPTQQPILATATAVPLVEAYRLPTQQYQPTQQVMYQQAPVMQQQQRPPQQQQRPQRSGMEMFFGGEYADDDPW
jgi:hypothetical protein